MGHPWSNCEERMGAQWQHVSGLGIKPPGAQDGSLEEGSFFQRPAEEEADYPDPCLAST